MTTPRRLLVIIGRASGSASARLVWQVRIVSAPALQDVRPIPPYGVPELCHGATLSMLRPTHTPAGRTLSGRCGSRSAVQRVRASRAADAKAEAGVTRD